MPRKTGKPERVLVVRFSALGDVAMTIPVVYDACRSNPEVRFVFVTRRGADAMFVNPPSNLTVVGVDLKADYRGAAGPVRLLKRIVADYGIDAVADLHGVLRTYIMGAAARLSGIAVNTIRKGRTSKRALTRSRNKVMLPLTSSRARYREVFMRFGLSLSGSFTSLYPPEGAPADAYASVTAPKPEGERWIGIAPFAAHSGKIYPPELMEKVVAALSADRSTRIFLLGGGDNERRILAAWARKYPSVTSLAEKRHGFAVELALMSHMDVMISMDSANMHLASLVGVPVVSIWGATHPYCGFKGFRQREADMIQLPLTCRPCSVFGNKPCQRGDFWCLNGIPPQMIISRVNALFSERRPANTTDK